MTSILYEGRHLTLKERGGWEFVTRRRGDNAVLVVAVHDEKLILVEQYRAPLESKVIELPAGLCDVPDEQMSATANRELLEETGYQAEEMVLLCGGPISPGLCSERIFLFKANGVKQVDTGGGIDGERITIHRVKPSDLQKWAAEKSREGILIDPKIFLALWAIHGQG